MLLSLNVCMWFTYPAIIWLYNAVRVFLGLSIGFLIAIQIIKKVSLESRCVVADRLWVNGEIK